MRLGGTYETDPNLFSGGFAAFSRPHPSSGSDDYLRNVPNAQIEDLFSDSEFLSTQTFSDRGSAER